MRVECAHGNRNSGAQAELRRPLRRKVPGKMIAGQVFAAHFGAHAGKQRIDSDQKFSGGSPPHLGFHIHLWPMAQTLRFNPLTDR